MGIIEDFLPYKDSYGLVQPNKNEISGNGIRYTCEYWFALEKENALSPLEKQNIHKSLEWSEPFTGLLVRHPKNQRDQEGPDDYVARIAISNGEWTGFGARFLFYGRQNSWVFANDPEKGFFSNANFARQPQIICHAMWAAGEKPGFFLKCWWIGALMQSAFSKQQDSKILGWYLVKVGKGRGKMVDAAISFWRKKFKEHYPDGGVGQVLKEYFGNTEHPSVRYLWGEFGE